MKNWMNRMKETLQQWMSGRNGMDMLGRDLYICCLVLMILEMFLRTGVLYWITLAGLGYGIFRSLSRNIPKRRAEEEKYLKLREKPAKYLRLAKRQWTDRKTHRYFLCPNCRQTIRVPKGKGRIEIRCPKCGTAFIKKT